VLCTLKPHPQNRKEKSAKKRRSKGDTKSKSESDDISERKLIQGYNSLEPEERKILDDRGLKSRLKLLWDSFEFFDSIAQKLTEIDKHHDEEIFRHEAAYEAETGERTNFGPPVDLLSSIYAVTAVQRHLIEWRIESVSLERLRIALISALHGSSPAMLLGPTRSHRPTDPPNVLEIKGMLAAAMYEYQRRNELSRADAARAVLKNIWPNLKIHLSKGKISVRMIQDWRDNFGALSAKPGPGRDSYRDFKKAFAANLGSHDQYIQLLTFHYGRVLPNL